MPVTVRMPAGAGAHRPARVLVLDGHCDAAIASVQSLGRGGAHVEVTSKDRNALACRSRFTRRATTQPDTVPPLLASWMDELAGSLPPQTLVIPSTEASLAAMRLLPADHPLRARSPLPPDASLDVALDKLAAGTAASAAGMRVPRSRLVTDPSSGPAEWGFPTVLKPVRSKFVMDGALVTGSAVVAPTPDRRRDHLRRWLPTTALVEQELVAGVGVALSVLCVDGEIRWHFAHQRLHELPLDGGPSTYRRAIPPPADALAACARLMRSLRWHGVAMVEFKWDAQRSMLTFLEINPRLWGSLALAVNAGVDFPRGLLALARGVAPGPQPRYRLDLHCRNLPRDVLWLRARSAAAVHNRAWPRRVRSGRSPLERGRRLRREVWDHVALDDPPVAARVLGRALRNTIRGEHDQR